MSIQNGQQISIQIATSLNLGATAKSMLQTNIQQKNQFNFRNPSAFHQSLTYSKVKSCRMKIKK